MRSRARPDLDQVCAKFEDWRGRPGPRTIPDELWLAAASLLDRHTANAVCQRLRLNECRFRQMRDRLGVAPHGRRRRSATNVETGISTELLACAPIRAVSRATRRTASAGFIDLGALTIDPLGRPRTAAGDAGQSCTLTIEGSDGLRVRFEWPAADGSAIGPVCAMMLGGSRPQRQRGHGPKTAVEDGQIDRAYVTAAAYTELGDAMHSPNSIAHLRALVLTEETSRFNCSTKVSEGITTNEYDAYSLDSLHAALTPRTYASKLDDTLNHGAIYDTSKVEHGNLTRVTRPDGTRTPYQYDVDGNAVKMIGPRATTAVFANFTTTYTFAEATWSYVTQVSRSVTKADGVSIDVRGCRSDQSVQMPGIGTAERRWPNGRVVSPR